MDELSRRRMAHNEAVFREINEEIEGNRFTLGKQAYVCECVDRACEQTIELSGDEYEAVRASPDRFVVVPGHVQPEVEHVVEQTPGYTVVEKDVPV